MTDELGGRRVVVTGANRGLGQALALALVGAGAKLVVHARTAMAAEAARAASGAEGAVAGELLDPSLGPRLAACCAALAPGGIDALILNAGMLGPIGPLEQVDFAAFRQVMEVNVDAQLRLFVACLPQLVAARGAVLWLSSGLGRSALPGYGAYCASKHAVEGLMKLAHVENAERGVTSIAVSPGMVQTDMLRAALGTDDVSAHTPPALAAAGFVRLLASLPQRRDALAGQSIALGPFIPAQP